jgi:hypothetical protein
MKKSLIYAALLLTTVAKADFSEISTPDQMVSCMQTYIQDWIVAPETVSWENNPSYTFAGKYIMASWHSFPLENYGILSMMTGPSAVVYCDYPTSAEGIPDVTKGFCKPTIANGDVMFEYTTYQGSQEVKSQTSFSTIIDSKLYCDNIARP